MRGLGFIYAIGAAISWGVVYTIDQKILAKISPFELLFLTSLFGVIILAPVFIWNFESLRHVFDAGRTNLILIFFNVVLAILTEFFILSAIKLLGAPTAAAFEIAYPFFVVVFSYFLFRQGVSFYSVIGSILIFAGAFVIIKFR